MNEAREHGTQPLDGMMTAWGLGNHDLVDASTEQPASRMLQRLTEVFGERFQPVL